jgi:hypothetical protein
LDFALRAILRIAQFAPCELVFAPPKKSTQKKSGPEGLPAKAGSLRFSPFRALAELAGFAAADG